MDDLNSFELDKKLLEPDFEPFQPICENPVGTRDQSTEYRAFNDCLTSLKIIGNRILIDSTKVNQNQGYDSSDWQVFSEFELDNDSFVIFSRILLDKLAILIQKLLQVNNESYLYSFPEFKKHYIENSHLDPSLASLLQNTNWYDHSLTFMRNKVIMHGGLLSGSRRLSSSGVQYRKINREFGTLSTEDQKKLQTIIEKYGLYKSENEILKIQFNPAIMLDDFLYLISKYNIRLDVYDNDVLNSLVKTYGCTIDVTILSIHIRKFIENAANWFVSNSHYKLSTSPIRMQDDKRKETVDKLKEFMTKDIHNAIGVKANYLVALGLSIYTENLGGFLNGDLDDNSSRNYISFIREYFPKSYRSLDSKLYNSPLKDGLYKIVRCGLVHEYFMKSESSITMTDLPNNMVSRDCGIEYDQITGKLTFYPDIYFRDFETAFDKYYERLVGIADLKNRDKLQENFDKAYDKLPLSKSPSGLANVSGSWASTRYDGYAGNSRL